MQVWRCIRHTPGLLLISLLTDLANHIFCYSHCNIQPKQISQTIEQSDHFLVLKFIHSDFTDKAHLFVNIYTKTCTSSAKHSVIFVNVSVFLNSADVCILSMPRCFLVGKRSWAGRGWLLLHYLSRYGRVGSEGRAQRFARRMIRLVEATGTVWNHQLPKLVFPGSASRQDATEQSWNNLLIFKQAKCQGNVLPLLTYKHTSTTYRGEPLTH